MRNVLCAATIALIVCASAGAQETRGKILGTVQDPQGGLAPGAVVKITNVDTQTSIQLVTNEQGYFEAWQVAGAYDYQPGALLGDWTNLFYYGKLEDIPVDHPTRDRWFNTDAGFEKDPAKTPAGFQKRQFPFRVDGVRGQALSFLNMSLSRTIAVGERRTLQPRIDVQNLLNRQHWQNANTNPTSTNFGKVTTVTGNFMRFITFVLKLNF